jgi:hypothetical protein
MDLPSLVATGLRPVYLRCLGRNRPEGGGYNREQPYPLDEICFVILTASSSAAVA